MLGAIIGDVIGSVYEFNPVKSKEFELFTRESRPTDDSIMTIAVGNALMAYDKEKDPEDLFHLAKDYLQGLGRLYPNCGFGSKFMDWIFSDAPMPYESFGNGAAMRISPVGHYARTEEELKFLSKEITRISHNHEESFKAAEAIALSIFLLKRGMEKDELRKRLEAEYYDLSFTLDEIREDYRFDVSCQGSVPQAIKCFLEAEGFEDTIRNAVSLGGDADTLAAIAASLAECYYGIDELLYERTLMYLDDRLKSYMLEWEFFLEERE